MTDRPLARILLVGFALAIVGIYVVFAVSNASYTLGCDYLAYDGAARRLLDGRPVYDVTVTATGSCGVFQYPPSSLLIFLPFTVLPTHLAVAAWIVASIAALVIGCLAMPVRFELRVIVLVLAGTSWPFLYGLRIGQIEALLFLLFVLGWRWLDRPTALAATIAIGALTKLQPALLLVWALLTGRWRAGLLAIAIGAAVVGLGLVLNPGLWADSVTVIRTLSGSAADVGANVAPAAIARQLGVSESVASAFGVIHAVVVLAAVLVAARWATSDASYLTAVLASQLISPIQWTHYAVMLFLVVAWLMDNRQTWAIVAGLLLNMMLVAWTPQLLYLLLPDVLLVSTVWLGVVRNRPAPTGQPQVAVG